MSLAAAVESFLCGLPPIIMAPVFGSYCRRIRHHQDHFLGRARGNIFLGGGDVEEAHPLLGSQSVSAPVNHKILAFNEAHTPQSIEKYDLVRRVARCREQTTEVINPSLLLCPSAYGRE